MYSQGQNILHLAFIRSEDLKLFLHSWSEDISTVDYDGALYSTHTVNLFSAQL
jgi:hypothetical protein